MNINNYFKQIKSELREVEQQIAVFNTNSNKVHGDHLTALQSKINNLVNTIQINELEATSDKDLPDLRDVKNSLTDLQLKVQELVARRSTQWREWLRLSTRIEPASSEKMAEVITSFNNKINSIEQKFANRQDFLNKLNALKDSFFIDIQARSEAIKEISDQKSENAEQMIEKFAQISKILEKNTNEH